VLELYPFVIESCTTNQRPPIMLMMNRNGTPTKRKRPPPDVPPPVLAWLKTTFVIDPKGHHPKAKVYEAYEYFCRTNSLRPKDPNIFGRIILQVFPHILTRRFGPPGRQITHYSGIIFNPRSCTQSLSPLLPVLTSRSRGRKAMLLDTEGLDERHSDEWSVRGESPLKKRRIGGYAECWATEHGHVDLLHLYTTIESAPPPPPDLPRAFFLAVPNLLN